MNSNRLSFFFVVVAPTLFSLGGSGLTRLGVIPNLVLMGRYHADLATLWLVAGLSVSLVVASAWAGRRWREQRVSSALAEEREGQAADRRQFLRRLDHELKNPLTTICLGITNLQSSGRLQADEVSSLERIAHQMQRLHGLVEDLRRLAELDEAHLDRTRTSLPEILEESVLLAQGTPEWAARAVDMKLQQVPWPVAHVWGDRDLLVVAFRNLVENALKFTAINDRVEVRVADDGRHAVVEVADTGPGIAPDELPHVFDELFRGQNTRELPGSGLGLALVKRIVSLHGGRIDVSSRIGQGTVVRVSVPLAEA
ncbi:MAG TPA: HAMP domain-containing sensor histidine kinase [Anaerolineales bacterium]|nr:HAMP domain-containing sensor histidine kinase [Anaerolineales bacterium]